MVRTCYKHLKLHPESEEPLPKYSYHPQLQFVCLARLEGGYILIGSLKDNGVGREQFDFTSIEFHPWAAYLVNHNVILGILFLVNCKGGSVPLDSLSASLSRRLYFNLLEKRFSLYSTICFKISHLHFLWIKWMMSVHFHLQELNWKIGKSFFQEVKSYIVKFISKMIRR